MSKQNIIVIRDCGGLGDIIQVGAVLDSIVGACGSAAHVFLHAPATYCDLLISRLWALTGYGHASYVEADERTYRTYRGAPIATAMREFLSQSYGDGTHIIDLNGPETRHERAASGADIADRVSIWTDEARRVLQRPALPLYRPRLHPTAQDEILASAKSKRPLVLFHDRPAGAIRRWPADRWRKLKRRLRRAGCRVQTVPPRLRWSELVPIVLSSQLVIAVDSGILHLSLSLNRPTLGLFGPTSAAVTGLAYARAAATETFHLPLYFFQAPHVHDCDAPCYARTDLGFRGAPCHTGCVNLAALKAKTVAERALLMMEKEAAR